MNCVQSIITLFSFSHVSNVYTEENEELMSFDGGPRGMSLYAFAPKDSFLLEHWVGNSSRVVFPEDVRIYSFIFLFFVVLK